MKYLILTLLALLALILASEDEPWKKKKDWPTTWFVEIQHAQV